VEKNCSEVKNILFMDWIDVLCIVYIGKHAKDLYDKDKTEESKDCDKNKDTEEEEE